MRSSIRLYTSVASVIGVLAACAAALPAAAQSIEDTMASAYTQSTQLGSARATQRATDELVPQALSNWRPTVTVTGAIERDHTSYNPSSSVPKITDKSGNLIPEPGTTGWNTSKTAEVQLVQNVYRGGRTEAQTNQATHQVKAGQSQLTSTEQSVLLAAAQAFLDVVRDQSNVELNANNVSVLKRELDATEDRFRVGEVTRTDVALSQSSYQQARAQYTTAVGNLATDRANFQRVVGQAPGKLVQPVFKYDLPSTLEDAIAEAETSNPAVIAAEYTERASRDAVDLAQGARLPTVQIVGTFERAYQGSNSSANISAAEQLGQTGFGSRVNSIDTGSVAAQVTIPLYTGGQASSLVRQAKHTANANLIAVEDAKRVARQTAISAWQQLTASKANIEALTAQVEAAQVGAEGTRQQALVGTATILDSLTSEQNLLQAEVNLASAQHDALVNSFTLLSAVGRMTAREMGLAVKIYDPQVNQDRVGDKWFGTGID
jgi:outer membrane protein/adhesin transport system outer membrane protein